MRTTLIFSLLLLATWPTEAQEFAFAPHAGGSESAEKVFGYKKKVAQKVFDDLLHARGDYRLQNPTLVMSKQERYIASFNPDLVQITLEEKAYDVCASFGPDSLNALAALLSHELTHYYEKHDWSRHFARENEGLETTRRLANLEEGLKQEAQADCIGGFVAFSVGYNTYGIMPPLLRKLYKAYGLPDELPGYPSLPERLQMVESAMAQLKDLQIVFEAANLLTILGNYADASVYHRHILQTYQSCEIYNNAGINATLAALAFMQPTEMPYVLPLELDPKSRLYSIKNNDLEKEAKKSALLKLALEHFDRALLLDEKYFPAQLNKACVLTLKNEWDEAEYQIQKTVKKIPDVETVLQIKVLQGVIAALQKDSTKAVMYWEEAKKFDNAWAAMNLETLQRKPRPGTPGSTAAKGLEEIEQFPLSDYLSDLSTDRVVEVADKMSCGFRQFAHSRLLIHYANHGKNYVLVQQTLPTYRGRTLRGIVLGDSKSKVEATYGKPAKVIAQPSGMVWVYAEANLFFCFGPQATVASWGVYRKST